jgi:hypothetical protein
VSGQAPEMGTGPVGYKKVVTTARSLELLAGRYELGPLLGQGGMAEVFEANDLRLGRKVAVKILRPALGSDPGVRERFEQEARTAARLSHPNVVGIIDTGEDEGVAFIIMERLDGTTLADELRSGPLSEARVRSVGLQVLAALEAAHSAGIVHRDIKPANVLTCPDGRVKVADFGIATAADEAQAITGTGLLIGTPAYLAPERLHGAAASPAADLYSLGSVLYQCLTGRRPFEGTSTVELIAAIRERTPEPIRALRPDVDPVLAAVVEAALSKEPADRPASAAAMTLALDPDQPTSTLQVGGLEATRVLPLECGSGRSGSTAVLPAAAEPDGDGARARSDAYRRLAHGAFAAAHHLLGAARRAVARYRIAVAFVGAAAGSLLLALALTASPPAPPPVTRPTATIVPLKGVPAPLARALTRLERAVR